MTSGSPSKTLLPNRFFGTWLIACLRQTVGQQPAVAWLSNPAPSLSMRMLSSVTGHRVIIITSKTKLFVATPVTKKKAKKAANNGGTQKLN